MIVCSCNRSSDRAIRGCARPGGGPVRVRLLNNNASLSSKAVNTSTLTFDNVYVQQGIEGERMIYGKRGGSHASLTRNVPTAERQKFCISDAEVLSLADIAVRIEAHYSKHAGSAMPMASHRQFMELAVNIPEQEPHVGHAVCSSFVNCASVILPAWSSATPLKTEIKSDLAAAG